MNCVVGSREKRDLFSQGSSRVGHVPPLCNPERLQASYRVDFEEEAQSVIDRCTNYRRNRAAALITLTPSCFAIAWIAVANAFTSNPASGNTVRSRSGVSEIDYASIQYRVQSIPRMKSTSSTWYRGTTPQ